LNEITIKYNAFPSEVINTIQDHIPAIIGGSVGGIIVIVGVFVLHKYIYAKKMKYEGQKNGQINHFDTPAQNGPPPRDTSHDIDIDMYNSITLNEITIKYNAFPSEVIR
jgi:hypothetical protein